jgi:thiol:disulfide interchange protein DsbC
MAFMVIFFSTSFAQGKNPCDNIDLTWLKKHSPIPPGQMVSKHNLGSLCEIILKFGNEYVPVFAGDDFITAGEMLKNRKQVTKAKIDAFKAEGLRSLIPQLDSVVAMAYTPTENNNHKIYMITDPLCPYCNTAAEKIIPLADAYGVIIKTVLYSVHGLEGEQKSMEAICRNFSLSQYADKAWKALPFDEKYQGSRYLLRHLPYPAESNLGR